ncbi:MAG TPA: helix-turn-helix transcriptional regulator [Xanthomonadaceae bacterium]|nr:helix-turn-helix transcriptional regulator [Xanthomonadaceae bacterium]
MSQSRAIHTALKRQMRARGRTYAQAAPVLGLSEASVKRLFSRAELSIDRLERLCDWLHLDVAELVQQSAAAAPLVTMLSPDQERELLRDPSLLLTAYLVLNHWDEAAILAAFRLDKRHLEGHLLRLARLGLIELAPFGRIRLRTARNFAWRKDGPIQRHFAERVLPEFLASRFTAADERMHFFGGMLSRRSLSRLHDAMQELARRFDELLREDLDLPVAERDSVSLFIAARPWEFSDFAGLRRTAQAHATSAGPAG